MKIHEILQRDIQDAIQCGSLLNGVEIGGTAKDHNVVILAGMNEHGVKTPKAVTINFPDIEAANKKNSNEIRSALKRNLFLKSHLQRLTEMCELCNSFI